MEFAQDRYAGNSYDEAFQQTQDDRRLHEIIPTPVPKHGGIHAVNSTTSDLGWTNVIIHRSVLWWFWSGMVDVFSVLVRLAIYKSIINSHGAASGMNTPRI